MRLIRAIATVAFVLCGLIPATQASAQFYFGGSGGLSDIGEGITTGLITSGTADVKDNGFKGFVGYQFNEYVGVEIAYLDLGTATYSGNFLGTPVTGGKAEVTGVNYSLVVSIPLSPSFAIFAKAGMFTSDVKISDTTGGAPFTLTSKKTSDSFGLGASYDIFKHLSVRAEWERLKIETPINSTAAYFWSAGVAIKF